MPKDVGSPTQPKGRDTLSSSYENWKPRYEGTVDKKEFTEKLNKKGDG